MTHTTADALSTCTQLEADVALSEWQQQRHLPPSIRVVGNDPALAAFEAQMAAIDAIMSAPQRVAA